MFAAAAASHAWQSPNSVRKDGMCQSEETACAFLTAACAASWLSAPACHRAAPAKAQLSDDTSALATLGGALARAAWGGFMRAAQEIAQQGSFNALADAASGAALDRFFSEDLQRRKAPPGYVKYHRSPHSFNREHEVLREWRDAGDLVLAE